ncbi:MAG TPA: hypothetical protein VL993_03135 [Stellaceae bacterium]|nr:hypothetical protein [Stellaceae bacterium]
MATYRIYFRGRSGIVGRQDYDAEQDGDALWIAVQLADACGDICTEFELWDGTRRVDVPGQKPILPDDIGDAARTSFFEAAEKLQQSRWAVGQSHRLKARLDQTRKP